MRGTFVILLMIGSLFIGLSAARALTPEQVLKLKQAGVSDETIQLMIRQEREAGDNPYERFGKREIKDEDGKTVVVYSTGARDRSSPDPEREKAEKAWDMLRHMIIDAR